MKTSEKKWKTLAQCVIARQIHEQQLEIARSLTISAMGHSDRYHMDWRSWWLQMVGQHDPDLYRRYVEARSARSEAERRIQEAKAAHK